MASRGRGSRTKGANFERELAKILDAKTPLDAKRGIGQTRGGGAEISDIDIEIVHIEAKRHIRSNIKRAMEQAKADSDINGKIPVAITKDDRKPILCTMYLDDWIDFFNAYIEVCKKK